MFVGVSPAQFTARSILRIVLDLLLQKEVDGIMSNNIIALKEEGISLVRDLEK